jgi:6-phosphofructokinase 2
MAGGPTGEILENLLEKEGVDWRTLPTEKWTRENLMVREEGEGNHQFRFDMPGPGLSEGEWKRCLSEVRQLDPEPDLLVASGSLPPGVPSDFYARLAREARDVGARFVLDTSGSALEQGLEGGVFLLKPNLRELEALTGRELEKEAEDGGGEQDDFGPDQERESHEGAEYEEAQIDAARTLVESGWVEVVVVSMGSAGALLVTEEAAEKIPTPTVPIRSRVGAGDCMVAGLVLGLAQGWELGDAARLGVASGAAAVMTPGSELCRRKDVEALFTRMAEGSAPGFPTASAKTASEQGD